VPENPLVRRPDLLGIYLNDHLVGANAGVDLARRIAAGPAGRLDRRALGGIADQIAQDRRSLLDAMSALDLPVNRVKAAVGWLGEKIGRLKPNGRLIHRSPLSDLVELEAMHLGVLGKAAGWRVLRDLAGRDARLNAAEFDRLLDRAHAQADILEAQRRHAAGYAFDEPDSGIGTRAFEASEPPADDTTATGRGGAERVFHYSRLLKVVIDVPAADHAVTADFWQDALGQPLTGLYEDHPEYRGGQVPGQDLTLLVQRLGTGAARVHLDLHTDDLDAEVERLEQLGATRGEKVQRWWVMRDPAGLPFCVLPSPSGTLNDGNAARWD